MRIWLALGAGIAAIALLIGAYAYGRSDGSAIERDKRAAIDAAVLLERVGREEKVDQLGAGQVQAEQKRDETVRNIYVEVPKLIDRPVYSNVCVDADGVQLLDRAAGVGSADAGNAAEPATQ